MDGLKRMGNVLQGIVKVLFGVLMLLVFFGTAILDKRADVPYPNTVKLPNAVFYAIAIVLLWLLYRVFFDTRSQRLGMAGESGGRVTRRYYIALAVLFVIVAILQFFITRWMLIPEELFKGGDFKTISACAWDIANGGSFKGYTYFQMGPNNLNITIVLSWVFRIFGNKKAAILLGAMLTNASVILTSLAVYNTLKRESVAFTLALVGEIFTALTWRAFLPYSDNYGMIFIALMLWLYTTKLRPEIKVPLIILCAACGTFIKITCLICFVALAINGLIRWLCDEHRKLIVRRMALYTASLVLLFGGMFLIQDPIHSYYGFVPGKYPKGWQFMFMVGQNTEGVGAVGGDNNKVRKAYIKEYGNLAEVNQAFVRRSFGFIRERGITGNPVFYERKLTHVYNDGYFHNVQSSLLNKKKETFLYSIYAKKGKYYACGANLMQTLWDAVLLTMMLYSLSQFLSFLRRRRNPGLAPTRVQPSQERNMANLLKLVIIGVTLYLMLLEGRAKYLYMFMPGFLAAFGVMLQTVCLDVSAVRSRRRADLT